MPANKENWTDYMWQKQPICPHCDKKIDISNDDFDGLYDEDSAHWFECPFCEHEQGNLKLGFQHSRPT